MPSLDNNSVREDTSHPEEPVWLWLSGGFFPLSILNEVTATKLNAPERDSLTQYALLICFQENQSLIGKNVKSHQNCFKVLKIPTEQITERIWS